MLSSRRLRRPASLRRRRNHAACPAKRRPWRQRLRSRLARRSTERRPAELRHRPHVRRPAPVQSRHVTVECGSPRSCGVSSTQIGADQFENLGFGEIRISRRPCLPTFPGECQVGYGRQRYSSDWNDTRIAVTGDSAGGALIGAHTALGVSCIAPRSQTFVRTIERRSDVIVAGRRRRSLI